MKTIFVAVGLALLAQAGAEAEPIDAAPPAKAPAAKAPTATTDAAGLEAATQKFNAYVVFMNRTLRAIDSIDRYRSWVNWKTGPTGRERYVSYGLYGVYDTRDERSAAESELDAPPHLPDLDDAMRAYIAANDTLAPILNKANGYYSRADYKLDHMAEGKALHAQIVPAAEAFIAARAQLEKVMRIEKFQLDQIRLATIEKQEGRDARWHVANVMMHAKQTLDALDDGSAPHGTVDMTTFDADMVGFGTAVKAMDDYNAEHPGSFAAFETFPDSMLGRLREVQGRLQHAHGNLHRAAGLDMSFILNDYNTMVTTAQTATMFSK